VKNIKFGIFTLSIFLVCFFINTPVFPVPKSDDVFPLEIGCWWIYDVKEIDSQIIVKVTGRKKVGNFNCYMIEMGDDNGNISSIEYYAKKGKKILIVGEKDPARKKVTIYKKPKVYLKLPLKVGLKWTVSETLKNGKKVVETRKVFAKKKVRVPGGEFNAFHVKHYVTKSGKTHEKMDTWYAPGTGEVKMILKGRANVLNFFLKEYNLKKM